MHFVALRKSDALTEAGKHPGEPWLDTVLHPSASGVRVQFREGQAHVAPLAPGNGLVAGLAAVDAVSREDAIAIVKQRLDQFGDEPVEIEVRETGCPGGLAGVAPLPASSHLRRFIILLKSEDLENGFVPGPELLEPMALRNDIAVAGSVMLAGDGLLPSVKGARVTKTARGKYSVIDGPFAEAKELIAGYWMIQVASIDDAIRWVETYPYPVRNHCDVEIRQVV